MNKSNLTTANEAAAIFARLRAIVAALRETTLTSARRAWFENLCNEFRALLSSASVYTFADWQNNEIANGADDFNEAALFYMGVTTAAPSLHYEK